VAKETEATRPSIPPNDAFSVFADSSTIRKISMLSTDSDTLYSSYRWTPLKCVQSRIPRRSGDVLGTKSRIADGRLAQKPFFWVSITVAATSWSECLPQNWTCRSFSKLCRKHRISSFSRTAGRKSYFRVGSFEFMARIIDGISTGNITTMNRSDSSNTTRRFAFSEEEMADAFEKRLLDDIGIIGIGHFSRVFREVNCQRGRPYFIAFKCGCSDFLYAESMKLKYSGSLVLSFLHQRAPRTPAYLAAQSGLTLRSVKAALIELVRCQYTFETQTGSFILNSEMTLHDIINRRTLCFN